MLFQYITQQSTLVLLQRNDVRRAIKALNVNNIVSRNITVLLVVKLLYKFLKGFTVCGQVSSEIFFDVNHGAIKTFQVKLS